MKASRCLLDGSAIDNFCLFGDAILRFVLSICGEYGNRDVRWTEVYKHGAKLKSHSPIARVNRRQLFLLGTAAVLSSQLPSFALAATHDLETRFFEVSRRLVNHDLSPAVGHRIAVYAKASHPNLGDMLDRISAAATARNASKVEDFFDDLPQGELRDFAYWVISAWYTGSSSQDRDATLFTYEEALLYQPTIDMVPIPTFGFSAPNGWGNDLYPLTALPRF